MDADTALALFDRQIRQTAGERAGRVRREAGTRPDDGGWVTWSGFTAADADAVIAEQQAHFAGLGLAFEWKHYGYDTPPDLPARLLAAGFVAEPTETLLVADIGELLAGPLADAGLPSGVQIRQVDDDEGFAAIVAVQAAVWGGEWRSLAHGLAAERAADPTALSVFRATAGGETVCNAWIRFHAGSDFASLWGGGTLPAWRGRGIYRALVAHRARLAAVRGFRYLQVDATDDSRPILRRLGFVALTTTTPYVWSPLNRA